MKLTVNGNHRESPADQTVASLLGEMGMDGRPVAVEVNSQLVPKRQHENVTLRDGDVIELVTLVGGG